MNSADVVALAGELPGTVVNDHRNWSALTVDEKGFCWVSHVDEVAMVKATLDEQAMLLATNPAAYSHGRTTATSAWVIVELVCVDDTEFAELLAEAWRLSACGADVAAYDVTRGLV